DQQLKGDGSTSTQRHGELFPTRRADPKPDERTAAALANKDAKGGVIDKKDPRSLKEGYILKASSHVKAMDMDWKQRFVMLGDNCLRLYRSRTDSKPTGEISLIGCLVADEPDVGNYEAPMKYSFSVTPAGKHKYYF